MLRHVVRALLHLLAHLQDLAEPRAVAGAVAWHGGAQAVYEQALHRAERAAADATRRVGRVVECDERVNVVARACLYLRVEKRSTLMAVAYHITSAVIYGRACSACLEGRCTLACLNSNSGNAAHLTTNEILHTVCHCSQPGLLRILTILYRIHILRLHAARDVNDKDNVCPGRLADVEIPKGLKDWQGGDGKAVVFLIII